MTDTTDLGNCQAWGACSNHATELVYHPGLDREVPACPVHAAELAANNPSTVETPSS